MKDDFFVRKAKAFGFESIDDFVKANLHYLSEDKQELFNKLPSSYKKSSYGGGSGKS